MDVFAPDAVFRFANALALLGWIALLLSPLRPAWAPTLRFAAGRVLPVVFAVIYVALLVRGWTPDGGFGSLADVRKLFAVPDLLAAGWLHYLAFDLFVGAWIAQRAAELRIAHVVRAVLLVLCFMFGPAGLLAYAALRASVYRARPAQLAAVAA